MSDLTRKEKAKAMRNGQMKMEREGCDWSIEDDIILREMFGDGEDILDIAFALARKEPAIQQRIDRLGLYRKQKRNRRKLFPDRTTRVLVQTLHGGQSILSPLPAL